MYVNRNIVGAVVGVQPFGGECLSGTGPKAGGPLYMYRLLATRPAGLPPGVDGAGPLPRVMTLPGPTGEQNTYCLQARGAVLCVAATEAGARTQYAAAQATGNAALFMDTPAARAWHAAAGAQVSFLADAEVDDATFHGVLFEGDGDALRAWNERIAAREGPILGVQGLTSDDLAAGAAYALEQLLAERSVSVNTAAAGGNASLMSIG
jgi:RHH-type proline utilization regulon transcriptional repressor/proline dehydrogenase/delta 1-pyrroline-5-carboxylate dehydrogenase